MEYKVVGPIQQPSELVTLVNEQIAVGWKPLGPMLQARKWPNPDGMGSGKEQWFYQTMVRKSADIAASKNQITDLKTEINYLNDELTEWLEDQRAEDI